MSADIIPRELTDLAEKINHEHTLCQESLRAGLQHAINAGNLLIEAKALCAHGEWSDWLQENCTVSERTAQAYMRVSRGLPILEAKAQRVADLSFREAVALLSGPATPEQEMERARQFEEWAEAELVAARNNLVILQIALDNAQTLEQFQAIAKSGEYWYNKAAEVHVRAKREAGAFLERIADEIHREAVRLMANALIRQDEDRIEGDVLALLRTP